MRFHIVRKLVCAALILSAGTYFADAQETGLTSLQSDFSYGVFPNALDSALTVVETPASTGFSKLTRPYIFGGISNLEKTSTIGAAAFGVGSPLWLGLYENTPRPLSAFLGLYQTAGQAGSDNKVVNTTATVAVTSGSTTTNYNYATQKQETVQYGTPYSALDDQAQLLTTLSGINLGLFLHANMSDVGVPANNYKQTVTNYYNAAAAGAKPQPAVSDTTVSTSTAKNVDNTITVGVPVFLSTGQISHYGSLQAILGYTNTSTDATSTGSVPKDPAAGAGSYTNTEVNGASQHAHVTGFKLAYRAYLPPFGPGLFGGPNTGDWFFAGADATFNIHAQDYHFQDITQLYNYSGPSTSPTRGTRTEVTPEATGTYSGALDLSANATAGQTFYFDLGAVGKFGLAPALTVGYSAAQTSSAAGNTGNPLTKVVTVQHTDADGNGDFTSNGDTSTTITTEYANTTGVPGATANLITTRTVSASVALPVALKVQPQGWWIGFTIGAKPVVTFTDTSVNTATSYAAKTTTVNKTVGTGVTSTTVTTLPDAGSVTTTTPGWTVALDHNLGVHVDVTDRVAFDVDVSAAVDSGIWDLRNLTVQGHVALR